MRVVRTVSFALVAVVVAACDKTGDGAASTAASASASTSVAPKPVAPMPSASAMASAAPKARRHIRRGGIAAAFLASAAEETTIRPDQLTKIEGLDEALRGGQEGPSAEMKALHAELAAEVKAGKLDAAKLDPLYAAVDKAMDARRAKEVVALNGLHAALDPAGRKAVTAALRARQKMHEEKAKTSKPEEWRKHHAERLTKDLGLDDAQQKQLDAAMAKSAPTQAQMDALKDGYQKRREALLTAFEGDVFDASKLDLGPVDKMAKGPSHRESDSIEQLLPILKPDQRDKLAERVGHEHGHDGGMHGSGDAAGKEPGMEPGGGDVFEEHEPPSEMGGAAMPAASTSASH
ncbi:MAG: hypothetical protein ACHREM_23935 [Polyangiales bacterium]